jgi:hypothetical protein
MNPELLDSVFFCGCLFLQLDWIFFIWKKVWNWYYVKNLAKCLILINDARYRYKPVRPDRTVTGTGSISAVD